MYKGTVSGNARKNASNLQGGPNKIPRLEPPFSGQVDNARASTVIMYPFADRSKFQNYNVLPSPSTSSSDPMFEIYDSELQFPMPRNMPHPSPMARNIPRPLMIPRNSSMPWNPPILPSHTLQNHPRTSQAIQNIPYNSPMTFDSYHKAQMNTMASPYEQNMVREYFPPNTSGPARTSPSMMVPPSPNQLMQHQMASEMPTSYGQDARFSQYPQQHNVQKFVMHSTKASSALLSNDANRASAPARPGKASEPAKTKKASRVPSPNDHRFFMGTIEQVVRWYKMAKETNLYILYRTAGVLKSITRGGKWGEYVMVLRHYEEQEEGVMRGESAPPLQLVFYPIDRDLPTNIVTGQLVTCVGRMIGDNKMQVFNIEPATKESLVGLKRISFLCQWALQEATAANEP